MRVLFWLRQHRGVFLYLGIVAAVAAWSRWDRREMLSASPTACMTIDSIRHIDEISASVAARLGRSVYQEPIYGVDEQGCAWWRQPQLIYRD